MQKKLMFLILLVFVLVLLAGCSNIPGEENDKGKQLVINLAGDDNGYPTPFLHYPRGPGMYKMTLIFDSLLERGEKGYIPWLAREWSVSPDGKTYTFVIQNGVNWHDGQQLTAEDVKFSFEYFRQHPPVVNELVIDGKNIIESVEVIDTYTVQIQVEEPNSTLLGRLGNTRIIPRHIWEQVAEPEKFTDPEALIGSGPYVLREYNKEQGLYRFEAVKNYWGPKPIVSVLQFIPVSDNILAFNKGEIDLTAISPDLLNYYENNDKYKVLKNPAFWGYRLLFNMEKCPDFKEKTVRQAFAYAIDKDELVAKVARGAAVPASAGYLPVNHIWYNPAVMKYDFDIEKAKQLLQGRHLSFTLLVANSNEEIRIAELLKIGLAQAGVDLTVKSVDGKTRDAAARKGDYQILLNGHGGWGVDADYLRLIYAANSITIGQSVSGNGIFGYENEAVRALAQQQLNELDAEKRRGYILELQALLAEEIPQIPLYNTTGYVVFYPAKCNGWRYMFDHHEVTHNKLSYLDMGAQ